MSEQGLKYDAGKVLLGLLPRRSLGWIARAFEYGSRKYRRGNWVFLESPADLDRIREALRRHVNAATDTVEPETFDDESGLPHLAMAGANLLFLLYHESKQGKIGDADQLPLKVRQAFDRLGFLAALRDGTPVPAVYTCQAGTHIGTVSIGTMGTAVATLRRACDLPAALAAACLAQVKAPPASPLPRLAFSGADGKPLAAAAARALGVQLTPP